MPCPTHTFWNERARRWDRLWRQTKWTLWQWNDRHTEPANDPNGRPDPTPTILDPTLNVNDTKGPVYHGNWEKNPEIQGQRIEIQGQKKELQDLKTSSLEFLNNIYQWSLVNRWRYVRHLNLLKRLIEHLYTLSDAHILEWTSSKMRPVVTPD